MAIKTTTVGSGVFEHVRRTVQPDQSGKLTALEAELVDEIRTRRAQLFSRGRIEFD